MPNVNRKRAVPQRRHRRGVLVVEFGLVASIFFLFVCASIEFARLNMVRHAVDNAAYEGARLAILPGQTVATVTDCTAGYLTNLGIQSPTVSVSPTPIRETTDEATVTVSVSMDRNSWITPMFSSGAVIRGSATLRTERYRGITSL